MGMAFGRVDSGKSDRFRLIGCGMRFSFFPPLREASPFPSGGLAQRRRGAVAFSSLVTGVGRDQYSDPCFLGRGFWGDPFSAGQGGSRKWLRRFCNPRPPCSPPLRPLRSLRESSPFPSGESPAEARWRFRVWSRGWGGASTLIPN